MDRPGRHVTGGKVEVGPGRGPFDPSKVAPQPARSPRCPDCDGTGRQGGNTMPASRVCATCDGSGRSPQAEDHEAESKPVRGNDDGHWVRTHVRCERCGAMTPIGRSPEAEDHKQNTNERNPMDTMTVRLTIDPQGEPAPELPDIAMHLRQHLEGSAVYRDGTYVVALIERVEVLD